MRSRWLLSLLLAGCTDLAVPERVVTIPGSRNTVIITPPSPRQTAPGAVATTRPEQGPATMPGPAPGAATALKPPSGDTLETRVLDKLNQARALAGLPAVTLDAGMNRASVKHAHYLVINKDSPEVQGLKAHEEVASLPGATPEGAEAGKNSDISWDEPLDGISAMLGSLYHRTPMLDSRVRQIGFGTDKDASGYQASCLMFRRVNEPMKLVAFPANGQTDVELGFRGETPRPLPKDAWAVGYPITLAPPSGSKFTRVKASLKTAAGQDVPCYVSDDEHPAADFAQGGVICLFPRLPLLPETGYQVEIAADFDGVPNTWRWGFKTEALVKADALDFDKVAALSHHGVDLEGDVERIITAADGSLGLILGTAPKSWLEVELPPGHQAATYLARRINVRATCLPQGTRAYHFLAARPEDLSVSKAEPALVSAADDAALHAAAGRLRRVRGEVHHAGTLADGTVYVAFMADEPIHTAFIPAQVWQELKLGDPEGLKGKTATVRCVIRSTRDDTTIELDVAQPDQFVLGG